MNIPSSPREKINAAYQLLHEGTISIDTFEHIHTLLKGIHPDIDKKLAMSSELLGKLQKIQSGDVISLSAESLPEETEKEKKRKKALLLFINSLKNLRSEIKRVEAELTSHPTSSQGQVKSFGRIVAGAKGPFGLITIIALIIAGVSAYVVVKGKMSIQQPMLSSPTNSAQPATTKVKVIIFNGKKIPLTEFYIGQGPDCGGGGVPHYHAPNETTVKALDGTLLQDPGGCGFGKVKDVNIVEVEVTPSPSL